MSIADDLQAIGDRGCRELDAVYDYYEHTRVVWDLFRNGVGNCLVLSHVKWILAIGR